MSTQESTFPNSLFNNVDFQPQISSSQKQLSPKTSTGSSVGGLLSNVTVLSRSIEVKRKENDLLQTIETKGIFESGSHKKTEVEFLRPAKISKLSPLAAKPESFKSESIAFAKPLPISPKQRSTSTTPSLKAFETLEDSVFTSPKSAPPTPKKKSPLTRLPAMALLSLNVLNKIQSGQFIYNSNNFSASKIDAGSYMEVYSLDGGTKLDANYSNDQLLVKVFSATRIYSNKNQLEVFMNTSVAQYQALLALKIPVAKIINATSCVTDGCYIVEKIPYKFDTSLWPKGASFADLSPDVQSLFKQVKEFFNAAMEHDLHLDLRPDNLRIDRKTQVLLVDFKEEIEEDTPVTCTLTTALKIWQTQNEAIFNYFISDLRMSHPSFAE